MLDQSSKLDPAFLITRLKAPLSQPLRPPQRGSAARLLRVPGANPEFLPRLDTEGRDYIERIDAALKDSRDPVALLGEPGIGKTQLAVAYAHSNHARQFDFILWAAAGTAQEAADDTVAPQETVQSLPPEDQPTTTGGEPIRREEAKLLNEFHELAGEIVRVRGVSGLEALSLKKSIRNAVVSWLARTPGWLLILDNLEHLELLEDFVPSGPNGRVLLTTYVQPARADIKTIHIDKMPTEEGAILLLRRAGLIGKEFMRWSEEVEQQVGDDAQVARELAGENCLDGHALALDQAGAYMFVHKKSVRQYFELFAKKAGFLLSRQYHQAQGPHHHRPAAISFLLALDKVSDPDPAFPHLHLVARDILRLGAFCKIPGHIPIEIIQNGATALPISLRHAAGDDLLLDEALVRLERYSLLRVLRTTAPPSLSVHRVVQYAMQYQLQYLEKHTLVDGTPPPPADQKETLYQKWRKLTVRALNMALPDGPADPQHWDTFSRLLPEAHQWVEELKKQKGEVEALAREKRGGYTLADLRDDYETLEKLKAGKNYDALLGEGGATYRNMHRLENRPENRKYRQRIERLIASLIRVGELTDTDARLTFSLLYLLVHYWWDVYLPIDKIGEELRELCRRAIEDRLAKRSEPPGAGETSKDQWDRFFKALESFEQNYPPVRCYHSRSNVPTGASEVGGPEPGFCADFCADGRPVAERWQAVKSALDIIRQELRLTGKDAEAVSESKARLIEAQHYVRAMTNLYLAEALRYIRDLPEEPHSDPRIWESYQEAQSLLSANDDQFHLNWSFYENAEALQEAAEQHLRAGDRDAARRCFCRAEDLCRKALAGVLVEAGWESEDQERAPVQETEEAHTPGAALDEAGARQEVEVSEGPEGEVAGEDEEEIWIDRELAANVYRVLADIRWKQQERRHECWPYYGGAVAVAYTFLHSEGDAYAEHFYTEHVDRVMDRLAEMAAEVQTGTLTAKDLYAAGNDLRRFLLPGRFRARSSGVPAFDRRAWEKMLFPGRLTAEEIRKPGDGGTDLSCRQRLLVEIDTLKANVSKWARFPETFPVPQDFMPVVEMIARAAHQIADYDAEIISSPPVSES